MRWMPMLALLAGCCSALSPPWSSQQPHSRPLAKTSTYLSAASWKTVVEREPPKMWLLMLVAGLQSACFGCIGTALTPALVASGYDASGVAVLLGRLPVAPQRMVPAWRRCSPGLVSPYMSSTGPHGVPTIIYVRSVSQRLPSAILLIVLVFTAAPSALLITYSFDLRVMPAKFPTCQDRRLFWPTRA